jgi:hypothetical protein
MRLRWAFLFLCGVVAAGAPPARAENLLALEVEYSADAVFGTGDKARPGRIWRTPQALRGERVDGRHAQILIVRLDRRLAWVVLPEPKVVVEAPLDSLDMQLTAALQGGAGVRQTAVGKETIDGIATTKYRVQRDEPGGTSFDGFVWRSAQGIIMRVEGKGTHKGRHGTVHARFSNVRIGRQDPAQFEQPGGFNRVVLGGGDLQGMIESLEQLGRLKLRR